MCDLFGLQKPAILHFVSLSRAFGGSLALKNLTLEGVREDELSSDGDLCRFMRQVLINFAIELLPGLPSVRN